MNQWTRTLTQGGKVIAHQEGFMTGIDWLAQHSKAAKDIDGLELARVSSTVQRSVEYGEVKCSMTVTLSCPQTKEAVDYAMKVAFTTALEGVNDGFSYLAPGALRIEGPKL
jgi:hypothetical protein